MWTAEIFWLTDPGDLRQGEFIQGPLVALARHMKGNEKRIRRVVWTPPEKGDQE